jgi:hypothetical protein
MAKRKKRRKNPAGPHGLGARMEEHLDNLLDMMDKVQLKADTLSSHIPPNYDWLEKRLKQISNVVEELGTDLEMELESDTYGS